MDSTEAMGTRPVGRLLAEFSIPAIGGLLVSSLYNVVDRIFIGQGTGVNGMAAVTAAWPIMIGSLAIGVLFQTGARTLASVTLGTGDKAKAEEYVSRATGRGLRPRGPRFGRHLAGLAMPVLRAFGATGAIMAEAKAYTGWILLSSPGQAAAMAAGSSLAAEGRPKASFIVQFAGTLVNAALAPIFIFALGWGVGGAGLAVAISWTFSLVLTLGYVLQEEERSQAQAPLSSCPSAGAVTEPDPRRHAPLPLPAPHLRDLRGRQHRGQALRRASSAWPSSASSSPSPSSSAFPSSASSPAPSRFGAIITEPANGAGSGGSAP